MKVSDFDYRLPQEFIAQTPAEKRDHSRLMVLERRTQSVEHRMFYDITDYLKAGDLLVLNDTKVMPANLTGVKEKGGGRVEVLLTRNLEPRRLASGSNPASEPRGSVWECLVKPGKRLNVGSQVLFGDGEVVGTVLEKLESGEQIIEFAGDLQGYMQKHGEIPLPPYIEKVESRKSKIENRYQTIYAKQEGASAAPTAGLHFTPELLNKIKANGVEIAYLTLHTGLATFKPVYVENVEEHKMYKESFEVPPETTEKLKKAKRVIGVGTTTVRTLETIANDPLFHLPLNKGEKERGFQGETDLFIYPGFKFKMVDAMITNFHFPRSTLLMLVSAFAGKDFIFKAYQEAMDNGYRFFSFGDAMLIL
ncbi:tRNA preQ1(34) S-adenosylmethionine ribosyltransferase-isomerase QueA [Candidatus Saganbacteria bacterium]|nr:tRNA preQ1(34) S-adenosylmethionine ribosyltransferase-isomerase QueA [Candidatus Saganbacteria bacterium]